MASAPESESSRVYPNPFNPATVIAFALAKSQHVELAVYDVRGSLVRVLVDAELPQGVHRIVWDGSDRSGAPAASGVYFYRLATPVTAETGKMVLLK